MTERPILFSAPMVRAILSGTKTQTRRVLKQATGPSLSVDTDDDAPGVAELSWLWGDGPGHDVHETIKRVPCPYGQPGDRLWVRETFAHIYRDNSKPEQRREDDVAYRADHPGLDEYAYGAWCPSIHMPRWASRLQLEITGVRVERLQAISEADALAEGISSVRSQSWDRQHFPEWRFLFDEAVQAGTKPPIGPSPADAFEKLWESINGPDSWAANPWVWVVEFKRVA